MKFSRIAAGVLAAAAMAGAHADPAFSENFDNVGGLGAAGWVFANASSPAGLDWFGGNPGVFLAHAGADDSYIAANFNSTSSVSGSVDNWLITPLINLGGATQLTFSTQASDAGFFDMLEVRFSSGGSTPDSFTTVIGTIGSATSASYAVGGWVTTTMLLPEAATGRLAFRYVVGNAMDASYVGIDTISVTAVPEPSAMLLFGLGLAAVGAVQRRRSAQAPSH